MARVEKEPWRAGLEVLLFLFLILTMISLVLTKQEEREVEMCRYRKEDVGRF
jgi:hypothetical protein